MSSSGEFSHNFYAKLKILGGDMDRSLDRDSLTRSTISMYASQYKLPENHAEDIIYAPDEIITGGGECFWVLN